MRTIASRSPSVIMDSGPVYEVIWGRETPVKGTGKSWMGFNMGLSVSKEAALSEEGSKEFVA